MRIAINTRLLLKDELEGIGWFTYQLMKRITVSHPEHQFIFLFDRKWSDEFIFSKNITPVKINPPTRLPVLWHYWFQIAIPKALKKYDADLFLSPDGFLSLNSDVPSLQVIHDINFEHHPEYLHKRHRNYYKKFFHQFAKKASRIVTVSDYSKSDIVDTYNINSNLIDVVYNAPHKAYKPITADEQNAIKKKYCKGNDFFLFVSAFNPRKNIANTLKAFTKFNQESRHIKLVLVGEKQYWNNEMEQAYQNSNKQDIIFTGRLGIEDLSKLMASAHALLYPSKFEGFGIPIVEAMKCGVPVITSNTSSMPEVAGKAALFVNPEDVDSICTAMINLVKNKTLRSELSKLGLERAKAFSWDTSAEQLWQSILKTLNVNNESHF